MHNNFNDIEQRLSDFQNFEHEVTKEVWNNLEGDLMLNNSIAGLSDLEFDIDDSIWNGIESNLTVKRPKAAIWWLPGTVAAMLLLALGTYNLDLVNEQSNLSLNVKDTSSQNLRDQDNLVKSDNTLEANEVSSSVNNEKDRESISNPITVEENQNELSGGNNVVLNEFENTSLKNNKNANRNNLENISSIDVKDDNSKIEFSTLIAVNSSSIEYNNNFQSDELNNNTINSESEDISNVNNKEELKGNPSTLIVANSLTNRVSNDVASIGIDNNSVANLEDNSNPAKNQESVSTLLSKQNSKTVDVIPSNLIINDETNILAKNATDNNANLIDNENNNISSSIIVTDSVEIEKEDVVETLTFVNNELVPEDEKELKQKTWKVIGLIGIGNFRSIEETFTAVNYSDSKAIPGLKNGTANLELVQESEGKVGLNYLKYSKPVTLSFAVQKDISNRFGLRVGVNYSKLRTDFEIYNDKYTLVLNYISVPVTGVIKIKEWTKARINSLVHIRPEKLINHRYLVIDGEQKSNEEYELQNEKVNLSVGIGAELEIDLIKNLSLNTNLQINKYLITDTQEEFIREKQIVWPEFNIGLSQKF